MASNGNSMYYSPTTEADAVPARTIRFDALYCRTLPGILKIVQCLANIIGFICIKVVPSFGISTIFINVISMLGFFTTGSLLLLYVFHIVEKAHTVSWLKLEFLFCSFMTVAYLVTSCMALVLGENAFYAASFFGLCCIISYGYDAFLKFKGFKAGEQAQ